MINGVSKKEKNANDGEKDREREREEGRDRERKRDSLVLAEYRRERVEGGRPGRRGRGGGHGWKADRREQRTAVSPHTGRRRHGRS